MKPLVFVIVSYAINLGGTLRRIIASALGALALIFVGALPAGAHHNEAVIMIDESADCGEVTFSSSWSNDTHKVENARLVVLVDGEQQDVAVGESITVGPFEADTTIKYRIWGGGERDYDSPALADLAALVAYLEADDANSPLDVDAPGLAWHELDVTGCPPPPVDVEPETPTATDQTCDTPGRISVPDVEGVSYAIEHEGTTEDVEPGTSDVTSGEYVVSASADDGYALTGDDEWTLTIAAAEDCDEPTKDDDDSTDDDSSTKDDTSDDEQKVATLPETGMTHAALAGIGLALLVAGGVLAFMGARQRRVAKYARR